ncbi:hypothetical protein EBB07_22375 [Paenibacillaceae bacterium]|nr:hypothetical protein EBB07_22375 [Paenibacillaceae bacterium]
METVNKLSLEEIADRYAIRALIGSKITLSGDTAIGTTYCFAHHLTIDGDDKKLMVAAIRYNDNFIKINNKWFFKERDLKVAWVETKPLNS